MAVVGHAQIIVHAVTTGVRRDIRRGFAGVDDEGRRAGKSIGRAFNNGFLREAQQAYKKFRLLSAASFGLVPAISGVVAALSSAVSGLFAFGAQAAAAAPAALALAGAMSALVQAAMAVGLAMAGVGAAISAGLSGGGGGGGGGVDLSSYYDRIEQAKRALAMAIERANEQEEQSTRAVAEAYADYQDSIVRTSKAIDAYKQAQKEAAEQTQQLNFDVEDAALAQERAAIALEEARLRLAAVADLPVDSSARREAELAFKEADLNYRRAADRNNDLKQEQEEAVAAGSAGADDLVAASEDVREAKKAEADAFIAYQDAIIAAERARRDSARQILEAEEALKDAFEALEKAGGGAAGGVDRFAEAMAKLSPEAQDFVRYILSIQDEFKALRAAAGKELFPQLIDSIKNIVKNFFPVLEFGLRHTGDAIGEFALSLSKTLTATGNLGALSRIMRTNSGVIKTFGEAASSVVTIIIQLLDAARPLTTQFAKWVETLTRGWKESILTDRMTGKLAYTLTYAGDVASKLGSVFGNLIEAFKNLGVAAAGPGSGGEMLLNTLEDATDRLVKLTDGMNQSGKGEEYFRGASENLLSMSTTIGKLASGFAALGDNSGVKEFFDAINKSGGAVDDLFEGLNRMTNGNIGSAMGEIANNVSEIILAFTDSASIEIFFGIIKTVTDVIVSIFGSKTVVMIIAVVGAIHATTTALWLMSKPLLFIGKVWVGAFVGMASGIRAVGVAALAATNPMLLLARANQALAFASYGSGPMAGIAGALASIGAGPILAVVAAIAALAAGFYLLYENSQKFRDAISEVGNILKSAFLGVWESIKSAFDAGSQSIDRVTGSAKGLGGVFQSIGDFLAPLVVIWGQHIAGVVKVIGAVVGSIIRIIMSLIGGLLNFFKGIWEGISSALGGMLDFGDGSESALSKVADAVAKVWDLLAGWVSWLGSAYSWIWDNFASPLLNLFGKIIGWVVGIFIKPYVAIFTWLADWIRENWNKIVSFIEDGVNGAILVINKLIDTWNTLAPFLGMDEIENLSYVDFSNAAGSLDLFNEAGQEAEETFRRAAFTAEEFQDVLEKTKASALGVFDAFYAGNNVMVETIKTNQGLRDAFKNFMETSDELSQKTLPEQKIALFDLGQQYIDAARQGIESGKGTQFAANKIRQGREAFLKGAEAIGLGAKKAKELADKLGLTPGKIKKEFEVTGLDKLQALNDEFATLAALTGSTTSFAGPDGRQTAGSRFMRDETRQAQSVLSASIEAELKLVYAVGQSSGNPMYVHVTNTSSFPSGSGGSDDTTPAGDSGGGQDYGNKPIPIGAYISASLARGGIVRPSRFGGGTIVEVAEAGRPERVEPLDPSGMSKRDRAMIDYLTGGQTSGTTINVYPSAGMDERDLAAKVSRVIAQQMRKGGA